LEKKMTIDQEIGQRLKAARGALTQKGLAEEMKTYGWRWSQTTVWSIEEGERPLRLSEAASIAEILAVTPDSLVALPDDTTYRLEALRLRAATAAAVDALTNA
jgi:transcriptional regulator with XRE-family HTH domain